MSGGFGVEVLSANDFLAPNYILISLHILYWFALGLLHPIGPKQNPLKA